MNTNQHPTPPSPVITLFERLSNSILLKMFIMLVLILFLLIPLNLISDLINKRQQRNELVTDEICSKWSGPQVISGPIIAVPYTYDYSTNLTDDKGKKTIQQLQTDVDHIFIVPQTLDIKAEVVPEYRKRGIYRTVVYNSTLRLTGNFGELDLKKLGVDPERINWSGAKLFMGMSDTKGLKENPVGTLAGNKHVFEMNSTDMQLFERTMVTPIDLSSQSTRHAFDISYTLRGSRSINFFPLANQNHIVVEGSWATPSFNGAYLPDSRTVGKDSFSAEWNIPSFDRTIPEQWAGYKGTLYRISNNYNIVADKIPAPEVHNEQLLASEKNLVQVNFLEAVNNYQQTTRATKYGILVILLTFASLIFTEIIKKQRIHLMQYVLIGCAMVLFYSLLLAFGEHIVFNWSYLIAAIATITLISSFIFWITKDRKICLLFSAILAIFYGFIFVLMQLQDFSLLVGTVGLFIILAVMMRLSTKINWMQYDAK